MRALQYNMRAARYSMKALRAPCSLLQIKKHLAAIRMPATMDANKSQLLTTSTGSKSISFYQTTLLISRYTSHMPLKTRDARRLKLFRE